MDIAEQVLAEFLASGEWFTIDPDNRNLCIDGTIRLNQQQTDYLLQLEQRVPQSR